MKSVPATGGERFEYGQNLPILMGNPLGSLPSIKSLRVSKCLLEGARISMMGRSCSTNSGKELDIHTLALNSLLVVARLTSLPT